MLGNRHFRFGEAALKDMGTNGLALQVDESCAKGTIVIIQFEGSDEPLLSQAAWCTELPSTSTGTSTYLLGCAFTSPLLQKDLKVLLEAAKNVATLRPKDKPTTAAVEVDPFVMGSAHEKRSLVRRAGMTVPVVLCRADGGTRVEGSVVDRSLKGLGILSNLPFTRSTLLQVRPRNAHEKTPSVHVQVRNCRQKGKQWLLGCQFTQPPTANVLMLFG